MAGTKPPVSVALTWQGKELFSGHAAAFTVPIDGNQVDGPSPMQLLVLGLAGCMAIDVAMIVEKGRHPMTGLSARLDGHRSQDGPPSRYVRMDLHYTVTGNVPREAVERAIQLSRDKYCSVWHSLRQDIAFNVTFDIVAEGAPAR